MYLNVSILGSSERNGGKIIICPCAQQIFRGPGIYYKISATFLKPLFFHQAMVTRKGGIRRKTRYKFRKEKRQRGKISMTRYFQTFQSGDRIFLDVEPAVQKGMYHPRFMGRAGIIKRMRGRCYEITINDLGKEKTLLVHPVHLKKA